MHISTVSCKSALQILQRKKQKMDLVTSTAPSVGIKRFRKLEIIRVFEVICCKLGEFLNQVVGVSPNPPPSYLSAPPQVRGSMVMTWRAWGALGGCCLPQAGV